MQLDDDSTAALGAPVPGPSSGSVPDTSSAPTPGPSSAVPDWSEIQNADQDTIPSPIVFQGPSQGPLFSCMYLQPVEMFQKFLSDDLLEFVVDETNR